MFISVLKLTPIVAARFQYETDFRPPCIDPRLRTRGIAVRDRLVIRQGVLDSPLQRTPSTSLKRPTLPPSHLQGAILIIGLLVPEHGLHGHWIRKWNRLRPFIRIPRFDLLIDKVLFAMARASTGYSTFFDIHLTFIDSREFREKEIEAQMKTSFHGRRISPLWFKIKMFSISSSR